MSQSNNHPPLKLDENPKFCIEGSLQTIELILFALEEKFKVVQHSYRHDGTIPDGDRLCGEICPRKANVKI